jgi:hypothetical protein
MNLFSICASTFEVDVEATPKRLNMVLKIRNDGKITLEFLNDLF